MTVPFDELFQHSPNAYMVLDRDLRFLEANQAYCLLTGLPREQLLGRGLFELFPGTVDEDGRPQADVLRASLLRTLERGVRDTLALIPYAITTDGPDGPVAELRYWSATHTPLHDADGRVVAVLQHTTDVTEVHRLREEVRLAREATGLTAEQMAGGVLSRAAAVQRDNQRLSARQDFLTALFAQAPGFMAVLRGPTHVFELANEAYEALVGRHGFIGGSVREVLPELQGQGFFELLDEVRATGRAHVGHGVPVVLRDGAGEVRTAYVDFVYQPILGADGAVEAIFVQGADVTERETLLAALRDSEARLRTIADLVPQMIWSARADGHHDYYNQRWYDFTGLPEGAADGDAWNAVVHAEDLPAVQARWRDSLASGMPYEIECRLRDRGGRYRWVLARALPVLDADGQVTRWMGSCTDIDEHRRARQLLERSEEALRAADRQKDQFLALLAHELRNPLAPIATAAQLLKMAPGRTDNVLQAAGIIDRQVSHLGRLVDDLLDVSRVTRGRVALQPRPVAMAALVAAAVEQTAPLVQRHGHRLEVRDAAPGLVLPADAVRVTQILGNLITNAAKYTPPGGRIAVEVGVEADQAVVRVHDTGIGIDAALLERVFDLFAQANATPDHHDGGLGIGLALARSLARLHGGSLVAFSPGLGQGSTFELRLPLTAPPAAAPPPVA